MKKLALVCLLVLQLFAVAAGKTGIRALKQRIREANNDIQVFFDRNSERMRQVASHSQGGARRYDDSYLAGLKLNNNFAYYKEKHAEFLKAIQQSGSQEDELSAVIAHWRRLQQIKANLFGLEAVNL